MALEADSVVYTGMIPIAQNVTDNVTGNVTVTKVNVYFV